MAKRFTAFFLPLIYTVNIQSFPDTDTLHMEFRAPEVAETRDLDADTLLDTDGDGNICGITCSLTFNYTRAGGLAPFCIAFAPRALLSNHRLANHAVHNPPACRPMFNRA